MTRYKPGLKQAISVFQGTTLYFGNESIQYFFTYTVYIL